MPSEPVLDQAFVDQLTLGNALPAADLDDFCSKLKNNTISLQIAAILASNPKLFLYTIALSCDAHYKTLKEPKTSVLEAQITRLITPDLVPVIAEICEAYLKTCDFPLRFYMVLYLGVCVKHEPAKTSMIPTLISFMAISEWVFCDLSVFLLVTLVRSSPNAEQKISQYLQELLAKESPSLLPKSFSILAKALETFFPVLTESMTQIYVSEACKQAFLYQGLLLNPEKDSADFSTAKKLLEVLSLSCIREEARKFNTENYLLLLIAGSSIEDSATVRALSLLCIVKLWNFSAIEKQIPMDSVFTKTLSLFVSSEPSSEECQSLLEALAYLSLGTATKKLLRSNEQAIEQLVLMLETSTNPLVIYGCLLVMANLCRVKTADLDKDTNTLNYLKSMSAEKGSAEDDEQVVLTFNHALVMEHKLVSTLAALKKVKENSEVLIVHILHSLSTKQGIDIQREIAVQGGLDTNIKYLIGHSQILQTGATLAISNDEVSLETRLQCLRTLATLCRSVNPKLLFSEYDAKICAKFLLELLGPEPTADPETPFLSDSLLSPADKLCTLLALTNLSSLTDDDFHSLIVSWTFEQHLKNLMIDSTQFAVQKATWELINNLISAPLMLAKFFNPESAESKKNLDLLVKMLHSQHDSLQVVIAGLLANATMDFKLVCLSIFKQELVFDNLRKISASILIRQAQNNDLTLRVATFLYCLMETAKNSHKQSFQALSSDMALTSGMKVVMRSTQNVDVVTVLQEVMELAEIDF